MIVPIFKNSKLLKLVVTLFVMIALGTGLFLLQTNNRGLIDADKHISQCYNAKINDNRLLAVLDSGHSRILLLDEKNEVKKIISPDSYVDDIVLANDNTIWTSESIWDGMWVSDEYIYHYTDFGREEYVHFDYKNNLKNKHKIYGLNVKYNMVRYAVCEDDHIEIITEDNDDKTTKKIIFKNAFNAVADICISDGFAYILDKKGTIYKVDLSKPSLQTPIYTIDVSDKERTRVPCKLQALNENDVYFIDLRNKSVQKVNDTYKTESITIEKNTDSPTVSLYNYNNDTLVLLSEYDGLHIVNGAGEHSIIKDLVFPKIQKVIIVLNPILIVLSAISTIVFLVLLIRLFFANITNSKILVLSTMFLTICVSGLLVYMLINKFTDTYRKNIYSQLEISAYVSANRILVTDINNINTPLDYDNESYKRINDIMADSYPLEAEFNKNLYCNIIRRDKDGTSYAIAYFDQTIGVYYPLDDEEQKEVDTVYETKKSLWNNVKSDISGTYFYVKVPVFDSFGEVGGVVAVGLPYEYLTDTISSIRRNIYAASVVVLLLLFMLISEISNILDNKTVYENDLKEKVKSFPGHIFRIFILLVFSAYNMSATFLPVYILKHTPDISISKELLGSIPITVNIFIIGIMSLFCTKLIRKLGLKQVLIYSVIFPIVGNLMLFLLPNYYGIFIGLIFDGIGVGIVTNTCYIIITYLKDEVMRMTGFSVYNGSCLAGINIGLLMGSIIAINMPENYVFVFVIVVWVLVFITSLNLYKALSSLLGTSSNENLEKNEISFGKFISNYKVCSIMVLLQNPAIIFNSFIYYFLPIYCDNHNMNPAIVSILFIVYTEIAVIFGKKSHEYFDRITNQKAMYVAFFINVFALLIYGFFENTLGILLALVFLGFAAGFCKPALQNYFMTLSAVKKYGEDRSMGVYNFTENIGESLGPIIFARIASFSPIMLSIAPFSIVVSAMGVLHLFTNIKSEKNRSL